jgi:hypothetical protein
MHREARFSFRSLLIAGACLTIATTSPALAQSETEQIEEIEATVSDLRELDVLTPVEISYMTREEFREENKQDFATDYPDEDVARDQRSLVAFGFIDPDFDLRGMYSDLYGGAVLGYYDPTSSELVVIRDGDEDLTAEEEFTIAHEVTHALQDQHFDLDAGPLDTADTVDDVGLAVDGLVEGDAVLLSVLYAQNDPEFAEDLIAEWDASDDEDPYAGFPPIIVAIATFPYDDGFAFVQALYEEGGFDLINEAYADPPTTTEQILHPEKYFDGEVGEDISVVDPSGTLGQGWVQTEINTFGEFIIRQLLIDENVDEEDAEDAAAGWNGDSYLVSGNGNDTVIAWVSKWDSDDDAEEFIEALAQRESDRLDADIEESDGVYTIAGGAAAVVIQLDGEQVTYAYGPDVASATIALDAQFGE